MLPEALLLPSSAEGHFLYQSAWPRAGTEMMKLFYVAPNMKMSKTFMTNPYLGSGDLNSGTHVCASADLATSLSPDFCLFLNTG